MRLEDLENNEAALVELGQRLARYRIDMGLTQADLAKEAGVAKRTVERLEAGMSAQLTTLLRVLRVLGLLDRMDAVIPEATVRPMQSLERKGKARKRASGRRESQVSERTWQWGDEN